MKKIESIYDPEKFGKKELRKIRGGLKATNTNGTTNTPRCIGYGSGNGSGNGSGVGGGNGGGSMIIEHDSDNDET